MISGQSLYGSASAKIALAAAALFVGATCAPAPSFARAALPVSKQGVVKASASDATDLSARRRYRRVYRGNPAAGLAIMGAMIGTIGAIAAHQHDDDYYYGGPGYYAGPGYYGPPRVYYAPHPYYGHPYYGHPYYGPRVHYYYQPY
ncbi:conserved hypothetical protein [Bradyrhizobium sp. ORS 285]|uniref:hypothetical protein n=1 Tax=Bradyrhizobium sp. ORS 285 TaxID=115808 RepID=UPI0002407832|nr:hypothetical protein [Bradyrhizobium sp. ORS 285]CCD84409.1 conserved exported hypothetical protein [Bradyrhizobium sp. ORS 285]SMX57052.1 conserved hypothetical protein [Bradyrhizobium sp. ORS 285]